MKVKILDVDKIEKLRPCADGLAFARTHSDWWGKCERGGWLIWYLRYTSQLPKPLATAIAIACAEHVRHHYIARHHNDDRPKLAIESAKKWLAEQTRENQSAAAAAASAAYAAAASAASAAYAAASAASAASAAAAASAAYAAYAAAAYTAAAYAVAAYAVYANRKTEQKWQAEKIRELCEEYVL